MILEVFSSLNDFDSDSIAVVLPVQRVKSPIPLLTQFHWQCAAFAGAHCLSILKNGT